MSRRWKRSRRYRRRSRLGASNAGPILKLLLVIIVILAVIAAIVFLALPRLLPLIGVDFQAPFSPTPTPVPTPVPTPTPHPIAEKDRTALQTELVLSSEFDYGYMSDPVAYDGKILFCAGNPDAGSVPMTALLSYDIATGGIEKMNLERTNQSYCYPRWNADWIVYLDAKTAGGGLIRAVNRKTNDMKIVKEVYVGAPKLMLDGNILVWTERTGTRMDKLFACDLTTLETVTVQMFNASQYGLSNASIRNGNLIYADVDSDHDINSAETSVICSIQLDDGKLTSTPVGTYVHDPKTNGKYWAWLSDVHGENTDLYMAPAGSRNIERIAEGVTDFAIEDTFIAYGRDEEIYVYFFDDKSTHKVTTDREVSQFIDASGGCVFWMDVTFRERDVLKFAPIG